MPRRTPGIYYTVTDWDAAYTADWSNYIAPITTSNPETTITTTASSNNTIVINNDGDLSITSNGYTVPLYSRSYISDYITYDYSSNYEYTYNPKSELRLNFDELYEYGIKPPKRCIRI